MPIYNISLNPFIVGLYILISSSFFSLHLLHLGKTKYKYQLKNIGFGIEGHLLL
jgi:hypothetical protein